MKKCFDLAKILLPKENIELEKWAVIACDQFTSQPEYWRAVEKEVGTAPSVLQMILPEVYLEENKKRISDIHKKMIEYSNNGVLDFNKDERLILVERTTQSGIRLGIVGKIDLEQYDYSKQSQTLIRATEETVITRIPPRIDIRQNANLESPHAMLLFDDPEYKIVEPLYERVKKRKPLYDFTLMQGGGTIKGYEIKGKEAEEVVKQFQNAEEHSDGLLFAVGDGNHSLATAKVCWENIKSKLSEQEIINHPARFALVEIVNLHSNALNFEPIHRMLFQAELEEFIIYMKKELDKQNMTLVEGEEMVFLSQERQIGFSIANKGEKIVVGILQKIIDSYIFSYPEVVQDYIHGKENLQNIVKKNGGCGILLQAIDKASLFSGIRVGGVLPRKTFSIGQACEKRYYLECRSLVE